MSIYLNADSKVIVQGITGGEGTKHTALMLKAGTEIVGGVNARKAGTTVSHVDANGGALELPVFGTVEEGRRILSQAAHPLVTVVDTMDGAADKAAELANGGN